MKRIVLASASPRRRELLAGMGLDFEVVVSDVEEEQEIGEPVERYVLRLAIDKASAVASRRPDDLVLAADTVVYLDGEILEKPTSREDAIEMLAKIAGREHIVYTGVALRQESRNHLATGIVSSRVRIRKLSTREIRWYVDTGEPMDKAGSYAVQGIGAMFIEAIEGSYTNVVGLPLTLVYDLLRDAGVDVVGEG
jgi:septum formation protein